MSFPDILPTIIQGGALGLLAMICGIGYKLASQYLDLKSKENRSHKEQPQRPNNNYDYHAQNARVIYDVSKTLSESVVVLSNVVRMINEILLEQKKTFEVMRDHSKAFDEFMRRYEARILTKEKSDAN